MKDPRENFSSNLTIRQLEVLAMAARSPTFSGAAKRLNITQPSLSNTIAKIERQIGVSLFDRTTRTLALTEEGARLAQMAEDLVKDFHAVLAGINHSAETRRGRLSMALVPSAAMSIGPTALSVFFATYPEFDVGLHDASHEKSVGLIRDRIVDFGVVASDPTTADLANEHVYTDYFHVVCRRDNPLVGRAALEWEDLVSTSLIMSGSATIRRDIEMAWSRAKLSLRPRFEVETVLPGLALVATGLGVTILPSLSLPTVLTGVLTSIPLADRHLRREIAIVRRPDRAVSKPVQHMIDCIRQCFTEFEAELLRYGEVAE